MNWIKTQELIPLPEPLADPGPEYEDLRSLDPVARGAALRFSRLLARLGVKKGDRVTAVGMTIPFVLSAACLRTGVQLTSYSITDKRAASNVPGIPRRAGLRARRGEPPRQSRGNSPRGPARPRGTSRTGAKTSWWR